MVTHILWRGKVDVARGLRHHLAREIDQHQRDVIAVDVDTQRITGRLVDHQIGRRLSAPAAPLPRLVDQPLGGQTLGDVGNGGRGQPRDPRQIDPRDRPVDADGVQGHALVMVGGTFQIGAGEADGAVAHRHSVTRGQVRRTVMSCPSTAAQAP
jgi:hypothetical protein